MRRYAARVDANQSEIFQLWRQLGALVTDTSHVGEGFPDCVVAYRGKLLLAELKDGGKSPSAQRLTAQQEIFHRQHEAHGIVIPIIRNMDEAMALLGARRGT